MRSTNHSLFTSTKSSQRGGSVHKGSREDPSLVARENMQRVATVGFIENADLVKSKVRLRSFR